MSKKAISILVSAAALVMIALFAVFIYFFSNDPGTSQAKAASDYTYILREYEGKIGVFLKDSNTPKQVVELSVNLLPNFDQAALRSGVQVADDQELARLLEDYTS